MGLVVTDISLRGFRSYSEFRLQPSPYLTILQGPNAVGKTNVVEAVQFLSTTQSFRKPSLSEVISWNGEESRISLTAEGDGRSVEIEMSFSRRGQRRLMVNGKKRSARDVIGLVPSVIFTPDDLRLIKDSSEKRRASIDGVGDQLSRAYLAARLDYERTLKQRNSLLKHPALHDSDLEAWDHALVVRAEVLSGHRRRLFAKLEQAMSSIYPSIAGSEELETRYLSSWEREGLSAEEGETEADVMHRALLSKRAAEKARGSTLIGPHRDEVVFTLDGRDARAFASQGQQRSIALVWKLAEVRVIGEVSGQRPLLLLDDVMSELDATRREALSLLMGEVAQTIVTTTNLGYFEESVLDRAKVVELS